MVILLHVFTAQLTCHLGKNLPWGTLPMEGQSPFKGPGDILMVLKLNISKSIALPINSSTDRPQKLNKQGRHLWEETAVNAIASFLITAPSA